MKHFATLPPLRLNIRPLVLVGLALLGLIAAQASWQTYRTAREEALGAELEAQRLARESARHQQAVVSETLNLLRVLAGISLPESRDPDACSRFLARQLDRFPAYDNLAFLDADGNPGCSARPLFPPVRAAATLPGKPLQLAFDYDRVALVLPREAADAANDAALAAAMPLREFLFGPAPGLPHGAAFAILDHTGRVLAAHPSRADWSSADPSFGRTLLALDTGVAARLSAHPGQDHLYVTQALAGAAQPLRLTVRLPADAAATLSRHALLLVTALALSAFTAWLLGRIALERAAAAFKRADWKRSPWRRIGAALRRRERSAQSAGRKTHAPGETTLLRVAYEDLKRAFAHKEERMQQIMLLDELSRSLQGCHSMPELAQAVARHATALFPGSSGALLQCLARDRIEPLHAWGAALPSEQMITLPLMSNHENLGILNLGGIGDYDPWTATSLAERAAAGMAAVRRQEQLRSRAMRDALTGLYNRRFLEEAMLIEQRRALRRGTSIGVLILDIDHFKRFNDTYGHDAGDILLRGMGALLRRAVREGDMPCRYGGEEFVVILPGADLAGTRQRAEALRTAIAQWNPQRDGQSLGPVSVSVGVAVLPLHGRDWSKVLKAADQALYESKHGGRNRVTVARMI